MKSKKPYKGRLAPSPTGYLHLGHASTFSIAYERSQLNAGTLVLRDEDIDTQRSRDEYSKAIVEDLQWLGLAWDEGPFKQSERIGLYQKVLDELMRKELVYSCGKTRTGEVDTSGRVNWRFRVPKGKVVEFEDLRCGFQKVDIDNDFEDFVVWRKDDLPSYELAVVVDDHDMQITEVVRGEDLLESTARQILIYEALGWDIPDFYHCALINDINGKRLAKKHDSLSIRALRGRGLSPEEVLAQVRV